MPSLFFLPHPYLIYNQSATCVQLDGKPAVEEGNIPVEVVSRAM
jgi:hypothetical protein